MSIEVTPVADPVEIPATMLAWQVTGAGEPADVMHLAEVDVPRPGPGQVLVDVWSAGIGFADVLLARGRYPRRPLPPFTAGLEFCGEIVGVGEGVSRGRLGERVVGLADSGHGSLARFAVAAATDVLPAPTQLDDSSASVFHLAYQVGWFGLYRRAGLRVGEVVLVHAAAGGVGSAAVQLGLAAGARVIAVTGDAAKAATARGLGPHTVIDRGDLGSDDDVVEAVLAATGGRGADVVLDTVGGTAHELSRRVVRFEGRVVAAALGDGDPPALAGLQQGNYSVLGLDWAGYRREHPELVARAHQELCSLVEAGALRPLLSERLSFEDAPEGLARIAAGATVGKLAVTPP